MNPQRKKLLWAALKRRGTESIKAQLLYTGHGQGAAFLGLIPGDNNNPSRSEVEEWLAFLERRDRRINWAVCIGTALAAAVLGALLTL